MTSSHKQFHITAANAARKQAKQLFKAVGYDRTNPQYKKGEQFDRLADQHDLAARGTMQFHDCPNCMNPQYQEH